jgi:Putative zinc-finger
MHTNIGPHVADDVLEQYLMKSLPEDDIASVEEHLLICSDCQDQVEETETFIRAAKIALLDRGRKPAARALYVRGWIVVPVFTGAVLVAIAAGLWIPRQRSPAALPLPEAHLFAMRGAPVAHMRARGGLILNLDATELPAGQYTVRMVDSGDRDVWTGAGVSGNPLRVTISRPLPAGQYWVRVLQGANLKREYGLELE